MNIPPLRSLDDVEAFCEYLLTRPATQVLLDGFSDMAARRRDISEVILSEDETRSLATVDEVAHAGRILASWTLLGDAAPRFASGVIAERMAALSAFAKTRWDFRVGKERDYIPTSQELLGKDMAEAVYALAHDLGMFRPEPARGEFDHVIVLGGLIRADYNRPRAAAEMISSGSVNTGSVVGLGAPRAMSPGEIELARSIGCNADTEQAALENGLEGAFAFAPEDWQSTDLLTMREVRLSDGLVVRSAGAPMNPDGTRANTGGAFGWFVEESGLVEAGQSILSISTPIYWIAGQVGLMTKMPEGATLTTVGADPAKALPGLCQTYLSQHYLQEIKTAVDVLAKAMGSQAGRP